MPKYLSNQKLWRIVKGPDNYYYEIKVEYPALATLKKEGII